MRKLLFFILMILPACVYSQQVRVSLHCKKKDGILLIKKPINGYSIPILSSQQILLDTSTVSIVDLNSDKKGLFKFGISGIGFDLLLFPTDTIIMDIDLKEKYYSINIEGSNAKGHDAFLKLDNPKPKKFLPIRERINKIKDLDSLFGVYTSYVDSLTFPFGDLYKKGLINETFYNAVSLYIKDDMGGFFFEYLDGRMKRDWLKTKVYYEKYLLYMDAYSPQKMNYVYWCIDWYFSSKYHAEDVPQKGLDTLWGVYGYTLNMPLDQREQRQAGLIAFAASNNGGEFDWRKAHAYYNMKNPNSPYKPFLDKFLEQYYNAKNTPDPDVVIIEPNNQYKSLKALLDGCFKGKPVFIDLWATWCSPCRKEFSFSKPLYEFLGKSGVEMLYLSIDDDKFDKSWRALAQNLNLKGSHYRMTKDLYYNIWEQFYGDKQVSVPRYILIGANGNVLDNNLPRPNTMDILYDRIKELLDEDRTKKNMQGV